ncbi:hypothetical protein IQ05_00128 [Flavobacterium tiangeerense]|uniref:Uncharacterized protein n=1 Tax=Flavobacterium tiangeerense TaxID=459471 RepID=A0ABY3FNG9_9FLAO|nr:MULTISPECIES: hypothetical protein [Flavobacterium]QZK91010.1 hypothetical protein K5V07_11120 [Flavobacterium sp. CHNK8]TWI03198.1 hypothetical protein IQ05_00128 [Flavobacterium tiangeerense]
MKKISILSLLFFTTILYSQIDTTHKKDLKNFFILSQKKDTIKNFSLKFDFKDFSTELFSAYNQNSKLNDIFIIKKDTSNFVKSTINFNNNLRNPKIDSFNPYGASDAKSGLIIGAIGGVFRSIFNTD